MTEIKTTDHGQQRKSIRDLLMQHGIDPNRMSENRDYVDMMQPYAEDLMPDDHGPQRQPAWGLERIAELREELARLRVALKAVLEWYDRDGSVGGCDLLIEDVVRPLLAADALRGEGENDERTGT